MDLDYKKLIDLVTKKNRVPRIILMIVGVFLLALNYNLFILPNKIVLGGVSGLAVILNSLFNWDPATIVYILNGVLLIVCIIFLGKSHTAKTIFGTILYPLFITLTLPLANYLQPYFIFDSFVITLLIMALLYGLACGLIYKTNYNTGGSDIIMLILNKYLKIPTGKASFITSMIFIALGGFMFGIDKVIYAIIIQYISTIIIDKFIIGISDSKMFYIYTNKTKRVKEFILNELNAGITFLSTEGGFSGDKSKMIMCVVPTKDYYLFKETVLTIDPDAFLVISDCYEVKGGVKRANLPFINE